MRSGTRSGTTPEISGLDREHAGVGGYGASRVGRSAHVGQESQGRFGPRSRPRMRLSRRRGPSVPSAEDAVPPRSTSDGGNRHPSRADTAGWRAAGTTPHATLGAGGCLGPSRGQHLRTELLAGAAWAGKPRSPRPGVRANRRERCVHPEDRAALMEGDPGLMGRPNRRMGQTCSKRTGRDRTRNCTVHVAGRGPARRRRGRLIRGAGYDGCCEGCGTHSPRCGCVDGVVE